MVQVARSVAPRSPSAVRSIVFVSIRLKTTLADEAVTAYSLPSSLAVYVVRASGESLPLVRRQVDVVWVKPPSAKASVISRRYGMVFDGTYCDLNVLRTHSPSKGSVLARRAGAAVGAFAFSAAAVLDTSGRPRGAARDDSFAFAACALSSLNAVSRKRSVVHGPLVTPYTPS